MPARFKLASVSSALGFAMILFTVIGGVVGTIAFFDARYTSAAETRQIQSNLNEILLSQYYAERRDILRLPERQRTNRDRARLDELNRKIAALGGK